MSNIINILPDENICDIFEYLDIFDLFNATKSSIILCELVNIVASRQKLRGYLDGDKLLAYIRGKQKYVRDGNNWNSHDMYLLFVMYPKKDVKFIYSFLPSIASADISLRCEMNHKEVSVYDMSYFQKYVAMYMQTVNVYGS